MEVAERVINPPKQAVSVFAGDQSSEIKDRIFDEFNSLAVVYRQVSFSKKVLGDLCWVTIFLEVCGVAAVYL